MSTPAQSALHATYTDPKRLGWLLSLAVPLIIWLGPLLYWQTHNAAWLWTPVVIFYYVLPAIDWIVGTNQHNPPESAVPLLECDSYYRIVAWSMIPVLWLTFIGIVWFASTHDLPWWGYIPVVMGMGSAGGFCINVGHELGHKHSNVDRVLTKIVLAPTFYGHFTVEHNRGHHNDVATPEDSASSRMGENLFAFAARELPGAWTRAWKLEDERLERAGQRTWSMNNEILQPMAITIALWACILLWLGWKALPFLVLGSLWANFQLTSANYVEHYGLLRRRLANGRYEACQPHHSWNSDHLFSNFALLHLQRHSDHHAHPTRPYQILRRFENLPQLPNGYFGMFLIAYTPAIWYRVMDPILVRAVNGDSDRINFQPGTRERLIRKYGLVSGGWRQGTTPR